MYIYEGYFNDKESYDVEVEVQTSNTKDIESFLGYQHYISLELAGAEYTDEYYDKL